MIFGKIVGTVTAARKTEALTGYKFLLIQPHLKPASGHEHSLGELVVAVDLLGAGIGEEVIVATGRAARIATGKEDLPVDAAVIGIVDGNASWRP